MTAGLILRDESGNILLDSSKNIGKILGAFETGTVDGGFALPIYESGTVFFVQTDLSGGGRFAKQAAVVYSGGIFTWQFSYPPGIGNFSANSRVHYGVY